jgi:hypothetical protein
VEDIQLWSNKWSNHAKREKGRLFHPGNHCGARGSRFLAFGFQQKPTMTQIKRDTTFATPGYPSVPLQKEENPCILPQARCFRKASASGFFREFGRKNAIFFSKDARCGTIKKTNISSPRDGATEVLPWFICFWQSAAAR